MVYPKQKQYIEMWLYGIIMIPVDQNSAVVYRLDQYVIR